jgi:hypothetical protein
VSAPGRTEATRCHYACQRGRRNSHFIFELFALMTSLLE